MKLFNKEKHKKFDFVILLKNHQLIMRVVSEYFPDKLKTFKTLQKIILIKWGPRTVVFSGNLQYFPKINIIKFTIPSHSGKFSIKS